MGDEVAGQERSGRAWGPPDKPEPAIEEAFDRVVEEGSVRLRRPGPAPLSTGLLRGIHIGTGSWPTCWSSARRETRSSPGSPSVSGSSPCAWRAASCSPRTSWCRSPPPPPGTGRWRPSAALGGDAGHQPDRWLGIARLIIHPRPDLADIAIEAGDHDARLGVNLRSLAVAVLAGMVITLMTRMQQATDSLGGAARAGAALRRAPRRLVGGVGLVAFLRLIRVPPRVAGKRNRRIDHPAPRPQLGAAGLAAD
jgi:hypothetical protein